MPDISKKAAYKFVILLSIVSLFADMTYEGARSITGPYLAVLGANAFIVGFVGGFGELAGYTLRIVSGYLADRSGKYWAFTIFGYVCNLIAVPLLALAHHWWIAAALMIIERTGKAIRVPPRDAMLSHAGQKMGMGWVFGLHEAIDQIGAMAGPLIVAAVLYYQGSYREGFAILLIPALIAIAILSFARWLYPRPHDLETRQELHAEGMNRTYWIYCIASGLIAMGYADFVLMAYHFEKSALLSPVWIPVAYAIAMGLNSITAPLFGYLYDRIGFFILIPVTVFTCLFAPLVFLGGKALILIGVGLWGIGVGAHESLMRAVVADMVPKDKRASAYGVFNGLFGMFWFLGSCLMGWMYDYSVMMLVVFSVVVQVAALPLLIPIVGRIARKRA